MTIWKISNLDRNTVDGVAAVDASLAANIAEKKAPKVATGTPW
jgi:hypothetical protein